MCNKTRHKLYLATILDLENQTPLHVEGCFKDIFVNARRQPLLSRQERFEISQIPETGPTVNISASTTLFHPSQPRKGSKCLIPQLSFKRGTGWLKSICVFVNKMQSCCGSGTFRQHIGNHWKAIKSLFPSQEQELGCYNSASQ